MYNLCKATYLAAEQNIYSLDNEMQEVEGKEKIMFTPDLRTQERMIEVKFGEELARAQKRGLNKHAGSNTGAPHPTINMVIAIVITLLAIAAFLLIYAIY